MDRSSHTLSCLFAQLGIDNDQASINQFINAHKGIPGDITLSKAKVWNKAQAEFIQESLQDDSDWAEIVDSLNCLLR